MARLWLFVCLAACLSWPATAWAEKRLALVVGNDTYESLPRLGRARADARAVAGALEAIGFEVLIETDATRRGLNRRLADLEAKIAAGDTVFFFFAGHGVAIGGDNVLLPVDMPRPQTGEENLVREEGLVVDEIVQRIQSRGALTVFMVLDACRDNPFAAGGTRSIGQNRGLTRIEAPRGVFVLYSAGLGQTALDALSSKDTAANSVFTRHLVPLLAEPGLTHVDLAKRVQAEVDKLAASIGHQQQPAYYDQIVGEFVLNNTPIAAPNAQSVLAAAAAAWPALEASGDKAALEAFIAEYGETAFGGLARERLALLETPVAAEPAADAASDVSPDTATPPAVDPKLMARELQQALADKGCYAGIIDGDWGRGSMRAVEEFNAAARLDLALDAPSQAALDTVKGASAGCPKTEQADGPKAKESATGPSTTKPKPATKRKTATKKKSGGNCFTFEGQTVCD